nr:hypothetical protein [uncultured Oscillibacter sp.]
MYNNKTRQAVLKKLRTAEFAAAAPKAAEGSMYLMTALINILAISIILVLVLVLLVQKENSAFGHAPSKDVIAGLHRVSAESR